VEDLALRRKALEAQIAAIDKKTAELSADDTYGGYIDETGARVSGSISTEMSTEFLNWFMNEIQPDEARKLLTCFLPKLEGQKDQSISCPVLDLSFMRDLKGKKPYDRWEQDLKTIQNKFTDVIRPLLFLWPISPDSEGNQVMQAVRDAIKLWCNANLYLTSARRKNVLKATDPH